MPMVFGEDLVDGDRDGVAVFFSLRGVAGVPSRKPCRKSPLVTPGSNLERGCRRRGPSGLR